MSQQSLVLAAGGLALGRVDDDRRATTLCGDRRELLTCRKGPAASAPQAAGLDECDQVARRGERGEQT